MPPHSGSFFLGMPSLHACQVSLKRIMIVKIESLATLTEKLATLIIFTVLMVRKLEWHQGLVWLGIGQELTPIRGFGQVSKDLDLVLQHPKFSLAVGGGASTKKGSLQYFDVVPPTP